MTAAFLREAAALMRERAEPATEGPWSAPDGYGVIRAGYGSKDDGTLVHGEDCGCGGGIGYEPDGIHIASWHPDVALAVADSLEDAASSDEACEQSLLTTPPIDIRSYMVDAHIKAALAVAAAYLGRQP